MIDVEGILAAVPEVDGAPPGDDLEQALTKEKDNLRELNQLSLALRELDGKYVYLGRGPAPDWLELINKASEFVKNTSRHVRAMTWLLEALLQRHGWEGLASGAKLFRRMLQTSPATVRPIPNASTSRMDRLKMFLTGDEPAGRDYKLSPFALDRVALCTVSGRPTSLLDLILVEKGIRKSPTSSEIAEGLASVSTENRERWFDAAKLASSELRLLREAIKADLAHDVEVPEEERESNLAKLEASFMRFEGAINTAVQAARLRFESQSPPAAQTGARAAPAPAKKAVRTRGDAIRTLNAAATYFETADPHSIVAYHIRKALRWMNQPVSTVMAELVAMKQDVPLLPVAPAAEAAPKSPGGGDLPQAESKTVSPGQIEGTSHVEAERPLKADDRDQAITFIKDAIKFLEEVEKHSFAKFPLDFSVKIANMPLQEILEGLIVDDNARKQLFSKLGVTFLNAPK
jgi:type VI secretion system protein ImpA